MEEIIYKIEAAQKKFIEALTALDVKRINLMQEYRENYKNKKIEEIKRDLGI